MDYLIVKLEAIQQNRTGFVMETSMKRTPLEVMGDLGPPREDDVSSDTENRNDNDVFRCGKCDLQFQSSYQLHHHIAYTHAGIAVETVERLANPYPVEPLALNLKHSNRVESPVLNKSREPSPLSKHYRKTSQSVALDLSKPLANPSEALDLSTTKLQGLREGEVTGVRRQQGEVTQGNFQHQNRPYDHTTFEKGYKSDLKKVAVDGTVKRGPFLADNQVDIDDAEDRLVIDCSGNNMSQQENKYDNIRESNMSVSSSQSPHSNNQLLDDRGRTNGQGHYQNQGQGQRSDNQVQLPSAQSQGHQLQGQGYPQSLPAGSEAEGFKSLPFPFHLQQQMMMMNGGGASPPISNYGVMPTDMQQSLMSFQQQMSPFMKSKPGPVKGTKVNRRARVKAVDAQEDKSKSVVEIYECKVCNRKFSQVGNFHNHMKLHSTKVCVCGICKIEFLDSYELQRHMRKTHTGDMPYKCEQCDREFSQYNNLRRHLRVHNGNSYKCHICGRTFNEVFYLEMHIGSHTGERTYSCGVCSLSFRDNAELQRHVQTHSAAELHTCEVCGKSFSKACVLRQHKKMHSGLRPFKCEVCDKAFIHRHHLKIHSRMHSTDKPYRCKICGKDFAQTSHLYKHVRQHTQKMGEDDTDVCTQAEIQALYPGLCQGSRGTPSPLTGVSDLSQSSGSPVHSPNTEEEGNGISPARSPILNDTHRSPIENDTHRSPIMNNPCRSTQPIIDTSSLSPRDNKDLLPRPTKPDEQGENKLDDSNIKALWTYQNVDGKISSVGCDDAYQFDGDEGLDPFRGKEGVANPRVKDLQEESTASDTMESDLDTEPGELSPLESDQRHDYHQFEITDGNKVDNHVNSTDFSYKTSPVQCSVNKNTPSCEDFARHIKEECSQMSQSMEDIRADRHGVRILGEKDEPKKSDSNNEKTKYSIEHLLKDPAHQKPRSHEGNQKANNESYIKTESELYDGKFGRSDLGSDLHPKTGAETTSHQFHTEYSAEESHPKTTPSHKGTLHLPPKSMQPSLSALDTHVNSNPESSSHDLQPNTINAGRQVQGHFDHPMTRLNEVASPMSSDRLSTVSSLESEMSRSRSSSMESEDKMSRSYKRKVPDNTREEDVTSSTDDHVVSHSHGNVSQTRGDNSHIPSHQPSHDILSKAPLYHSDALSSDTASPVNKPKQKRRRRQNNNKVIPPDQNYLPLMPNLGIDPQQMYLLQLHQMQMAMAASMAAGAQMYPFPGPSMMPPGNFHPYSPEMNRDFNRERSRSESPQVSRSHVPPRQEGLLYPPSMSPQSTDVRHSGSPTPATPDRVSSSRDEMMRYMLMKQEMPSNGHV